MYGVYVADALVQELDAEIWRKGTFVGTFYCVNSYWKVLNVFLAVWKPWSSFIMSGHGFKSRMEWKFSNFPHRLWLLLSDYGGIDS